VYGFGTPRVHFPEPNDSPGKIETYKTGAALMGAILFDLAWALIAGSGSEMAHHKLDYVHGMFYMQEV
jgi:hypothetical protein